MTVKELAGLINAKVLTDELENDPVIKCGYACDLLSWVMAHGEEGMAWVTVQTHMNVIAVAVLAEMACVVYPENIQIEEACLNKAISEGLHVLKSPLTAYEICGILYSAGIKAHG